MLVIRKRSDDSTIFDFNDNAHYILNESRPLLYEIFNKLNTDRIGIVFNSKATTAIAVDIMISNDPDNSGYVGIKSDSFKDIGIFCPNLFEEYTGISLSTLSRHKSTTIKVNIKKLKRYVSTL